MHFHHFTFTKRIFAFTKQGFLKFVVKNFKNESKNFSVSGTPL